MKRLASRIAKLEQRAKAAKPVARASVVEVSPTGEVIGHLPAAKRIMVVTTWPDPKSWAQALVAQQQRLTARV